MRKYCIFIPESIPLENKGEEAILRGLGDILFPEGKVQFHVLATGIRRPRQVGNIVQYPRAWFYSPLVFRELRWNLNPIDMLNAAGMTLEAIQNRLPFLVRRSHLQMSINSWLIGCQKPPFGFRQRWRSLQVIKNVDYVLAGHDGAFYLREGHVLKQLSKLGLSYGLIGCGMNTGFANKSVVNFYRKVFGQADFLYFRDKNTFRGICRHFEDLSPKLAPDPAIGMRPAPEQEIEKVLQDEGLGEFFARPVVAVTAVENAVIMRSFDSIKSWNGKLKAHRKWLAEFVDHAIKSWGVNILFLPHCTGPTKNLDDRRVAKEVVRLTQASADQVRVLETEYPARILKGIIKRADLLMGERTHSLIGAVSVHTPFICLGSSKDSRTTAIIGDMCSCQDYIYDMRKPDREHFFAMADAIWNQRSAVKEHLAAVDKNLRSELQKAGTIIKRHIENAANTDA